MNRTRDEFARKNYRTRGKLFLGRPAIFPEIIRKT